MASKNKSNFSEESSQQPEVKNKAANVNKRKLSEEDGGRATCSGSGGSKLAKGMKHFGK